MSMAPESALEIPPPQPLEMRWRRAFRSMRELFDNSDDTEKAMDFFYAIGRREFERSFQRFLASPEGRGRTLLRERPDLGRALADRQALAAMPEGSFGRAYLAFLERYGFQSMALLQLHKQVEAKWDAEEGVPRLDPARAWFRDRVMLSHDLFHVLTGYGTDDIGEATLLAFTLGQVPGRGQALLTIGAALEVARALGRPWLRYDLRAWRRGRRAVRLAGVPWEALLPSPLDEVRKRLRITPAREAHPGGILAGTIDHYRVIAPA